MSEYNVLLLAWFCIYAQHVVFSLYLEIYRMFEIINCWRFFCIINIKVKLYVEFEYTKTRQGIKMNVLGS